MNYDETYMKLLALQRHALQDKIAPVVLARGQTLRHSDAHDWVNALTVSELREHADQVLNKTSKLLAAKRLAVMVRAKTEFDHEREQTQSLGGGAAIIVGAGRVSACELRLLHDIKHHALPELLPGLPDPAQPQDHGTDGDAGSPDVGGKDTP